MRNIKFRAWDKKENKWVDYPIYIDVNGDIYWENYERGLQEADDLIVMQYTGLKDKNGVEIFEGDYVVGVQYMTTSPNVPFEIKGVVRYSERNTMFYLDDKNKGHDMFMHSLGSTPYILEVIGNIYENPDFMEE